MKRYEALKLVGGTLKMLSDFEVVLDDWRFVPMYEEFRTMRKHGVKYRECVRAMATDYNSYAMYVGISMKYSDSALTLAERVLKKSIAEVDELDMLKMCYYLAKDSLKDKDGVFNIRKYFGL